MTWTAAMVKDALRKRHPATQAMGSRTIPGAWTCIEEWNGIDLLAFSAQANGSPRYRRVGYEVKVSRSDYRNELRRPHKRASALAICHQFYFAVPAGLLTPEEERECNATGQLAIDGDCRDLWVPDDVGLVTVDGRGCRVLQRSPVNASPRLPYLEHGGDLGLHSLIRWVSARPDPRHEGVVERARETSRYFAALQRGENPEVPPWWERWAA